MMFCTPSWKAPRFAPPPPPTASCQCRIAFRPPSSGSGCRASISERLWDWPHIEGGSCHWGCRSRGSATSLPFGTLPVAKIPFLSKSLHTHEIRVLSNSLGNSSCQFSPGFWLPHQTWNLIWRTLGSPFRGSIFFCCAGSLKQGYLNSAPAKLNLRGLNEGFIQVSGSKSPRQTFSCGCLGPLVWVFFLCTWVFPMITFSFFWKFLGINGHGLTNNQASSGYDGWAHGKVVKIVQQQDIHIILKRWILFSKAWGKQRIYNMQNFHVLAQDVLETKTME